jgi:uncharacterized protein (TIGR02246 family)
MEKNLVDETQGIHRVVDDMKHAWNNHDGKAFSLLFAENGIHTNVFGQRSRGHADIEVLHTRILSGIFKESSIEITDIRAEVIQQGVAIADVIWTMTGAKFPDGTLWPERKGLISLVLVIENGRWKIFSFHNMELNEMPPQLVPLLQHKN